MTQNDDLDFPVPVDLIPVADLGRILPTLEQAMRGVARIWRESWIGISRRRDVTTLNGILPRPANTNLILYAAGTSDRLTGDRSRLEDTFPVSEDIDVLERHHWDHRKLKGFSSAAGFVLRPNSFLCLYQTPMTTKVTAELMLGTHVGGHAAFEEIEALKRDFGSLLRIEE